MSKNRGKNSQHGERGGQPEPMSGSKKVKNRQHTRQNKAGGHDM